MRVYLMVQLQYKIKMNRKMDDLCIDLIDTLNQV